MDWSGLMASFKNASVLVVGDICLDRWCQYDPRESDVSRETGIPRIGITRTEATPGAGGTVANNLAALGAGRVAVLGAIGQDGFGFELERSLAKRHIDYSNLVASPKIQTFTYSKVINAETGIEDRPRVDFINTKPLPGDVEDQLIANFSTVYERFDVIMVADQAETLEGGVVTDAFREVIADVAERESSKLVFADSRRRIEKYSHAIAKPNAAEAEDACMRLFGKIDYEMLRKHIGPRPMVVTQGDRGVLLVRDGEQRAFPAVAVGDPVDFCGAGDSFAAGMALALHAGADFENAVRFGSMVSSITIMKRGTGTASPKEVLAAADALAVRE
ncbi:MAG: ribokinase [Acidobacteria bacterium]|nr:ribokinase [Acidobacteriota bacterium]